MNYETQIKDITEIKKLMENQTKFLSLSGLSGILAGIYALIGAYLAYQISYFSNDLIYHSFIDLQFTNDIILLISIAIGVLLMSLISAIILSRIKAKKANQKVWSPSAKKLLINFSIPLLTGGLYLVILFWRGNLSLISSTTLIFYGIALWSASKYTVSDLKILGLLEMILGLIATAFPGYGLYFWAIGFGVLHIIYGTIMYYKYDNK